jgi:hypothetical protein
MSKVPSVDHEYHAKKDRLEITIKHYALKKKSDREDLIKHVLHRLEKGPAFAKANAKKAKRQKAAEEPNERIQVGASRRLRYSDPRLRYFRLARFANLTLAPPPFSGTNSTPALSRARRQPRESYQDQCM